MYRIRAGQTEWILIRATLELVMEVAHNAAVASFLHPPI